MIRCTWLIFIGAMLLATGCSSTTSQLSMLHKDTELEKRRNAAFQLSTFRRLDKKALPVLIEAVNDEDAIVREFAIKAVGKMDPKLDGVTRAIKNGLRDDDLSVRRASAAIFSTMNPVPTEVLVTLAESLNDNDSLLYSYVKSTFIDLGPLGVNALVHTCKHPNDTLRCRAASTLGILGCEAKRALPVLNELLQDECERVRNAAKESISLIQYSYLCPEQQ
jgi:HEAT repeat protein